MNEQVLAVTHIQTAHAFELLARDPTVSTSTLNAFQVLVKRISDLEELFGFKQADPTVFSSKVDTQGR